MNVDLYDILEIDASASEREIKGAFRKLAKRYHPDVNDSQDASAKFKKIYTAYEVLTDPGKKMLYDQMRTETVYSRPNTTSSTASQQNPYHHQDISEWEQKANAKADKYAHMRYGEFKKAELKGLDFVQHQVVLTISIIFFFLFGGILLTVSLSIVKTYLNQMTQFPSLIGALFLAILGIFMLKQVLELTKALFRTFKEKWEHKAEKKAH